MKNADLEGVIFASSYDIKPLFSGYGRWDPSKDDIVKAERLIRAYIEAIPAGDSYEQICGPKILEALNKYKRQYFGLIDENGNKLIWVNFFSSDFPKWRKELVFVMDGGYRYFNIKVNLGAEEVFDLEINGEA